MRRMHKDTYMGMKPPLLTFSAARHKKNTTSALQMASNCCKNAKLHALSNRSNQSPHCVTRSAAERVKAASVNETPKRQLWKESEEQAKSKGTSERKLCLKGRVLSLGFPQTKRPQLSISFIAVKSGSWKPQKFGGKSSAFFKFLSIWLKIFVNKGTSYQSVGVCKVFKNQLSNYLKSQIAQMFSMKCKTKYKI